MRHETPRLPSTPSTARDTTTTHRPRRGARSRRTTPPSDNNNSSGTDHPYVYLTSHVQRSLPHLPLALRSHPPPFVLLLDNSSSPPLTKLKQSVELCRKICQHCEDGQRARDTEDYARQHSCRPLEVATRSLHTLHLQRLTIFPFINQVVDEI